MLPLAALLRCVRGSGLPSAEGRLLLSQHLQLPDAFRTRS